MFSYIWEVQDLQLIISKVWRTLFKRSKVRIDAKFRHNATNVTTGCSFLHLLMRLEVLQSFNVTLAEWKSVTCR